MARLSIVDIEKIIQEQPESKSARINLTDAEFALKLQAEEFLSVAQRSEDFALANSLSRAADADRVLLEKMLLEDQAANDDRAAALALYRTGVMPSPSDAQRTLERRRREEVDNP